MALLAAGRFGLPKSPAVLKNIVIALVVLLPPWVLTMLFIGAAAVGLQQPWAWCFALVWLALTRFAWWRTHAPWMTALCAALLCGALAWLAARSGR